MLIRGFILLVCARSPLRWPFCVLAGTVSHPGVGMNALVTARRLPSTALYQAATAAVAVLALATFTTRSAIAADASSAQPSATVQRSLTVFIDPDTQEMDVIPGPGRVPLQLGLRELNALNTSDEGLVPRRIGDMVALDFRGRFNPVWVLVIPSDHKPRAFCLTSLPPSVEAAAQAVREEASHDR